MRRLAWLLALTAGACGDAAPSASGTLTVAPDADALGVDATDGEVAAAVDVDDAGADGESGDADVVESDDVTDVSGDAVEAEVLTPPTHEDPFDRGVLGVAVHIEDVARAMLATDPAALVPAVCAFDGGRATSCHLRLTGDEATRRGLDGKASFAIRLDDRPWGLAGLDLDAALDDPSHLRTLVADLAYRRLGLAAPRATLARLAVDGVDFGVYVAVESLDGRHILDAAVGPTAAATGAVFAADHPVDLWPWQVPELGLVTGDEALRAELTELAEGLEEFRIARLDGAPLSLLRVLEGRVELEPFLAQMAVEVWLGHADGYPRGARDWAVHVAVDGRVTFLPHGLGGVLPPDDAPDPWWSGGRLLRHCFEDPDCRPMWGKALDAMIARLDEVAFLSQVSGLRFLVDAELATDPRRESTMEAVRAAQDELWLALSQRSGWIGKNLSCTEPADVDHDGDLASACVDDCDDDHADVHPGAPELCNLRDDDCDGVLDDAPECPTCLDVADPIDGPTARWALCYAPRTWGDARAACQARGGDLVTVPSREAEDALRRAAFGLQWTSWWIGLGDAEVEGTFAWVDGTPLDYAAWSQGEPNDYGGGEDCAELVPWSGGLWNDLACARELPFICRVPAP